MIPIIQKAEHSRQQTAIIDARGTYTYALLLEQAYKVAGAIATMLGPDPGPVLFLLPSGFSYVSVQWGIWLAGGIAVPVHTAHPPEEIAYLVLDTGTLLLIYEDVFEEKAIVSCSGRDIALSLPHLLQQGTGPLREVSFDADAMIIYTSGTTGRPKGVVMTHRQLDAQIRSLSQAWAWSGQDRTLNVLPMHHVHGVINITCCALYHGAVLEMAEGFDPAQVASRMSTGELSLFMAVPTIYHKLIQYFDQLTATAQQQWQQGMQQMRLMVSGSAALPVPVLERWRQISGHTLLERYGMTEIGMALSNPLHGHRKPGHVGQPLPLVQVKLTDEQGNTIRERDTAGELYVSGETVFKRYWKRPEETAKSFEDSWFKTGDIAAQDADGYYKILGRNSSDIIKSGGYKISALEIESVLLEYPGVAECAVVALPSEEWGETIAAVITGNADHCLLKAWLREKLAPYKMPRQFLQAETLPRNAMGKVLKAEIKKMFWPLY